MHIDNNGGDFADTQRERAAVMRRSVHVSGILCFRLPALLRCLVTTHRHTQRETLGKLSFPVLVSYFSNIYDICHCFGNTFLALSCH